MSSALSVGPQPDAASAQILDPRSAPDRLVLQGLRANPQIEFVDGWRAQVACLRELCASDPQLVAEARRWAYYPWRRTVVGVLGPRSYRALRLDRNRNIITADEQDRLGKLRIGVIGLSVGHAIAHILAAQGLCGELRLADFDGLELSNLNRVPATVFDLGLNKAIVAARRIAELDPYLPVPVFASGLTPTTVEDFLDGLDIVIEECDSLDMKAVVREAARSRRLPVLMATSDRGLVDVERYDREPHRPILHGLLGDAGIVQLAGLSSQDKIPHVLRILDAPELSARAAASLIEVGNSLSTWPQLAGDVALGAATVAEAVRRIGLNEALPSGRVRIDVAAALSHLDAPAKICDDHPVTPHHATVAATATPCNVVAAAAIRAPSGGNAQPWHVETDEDSLTIRLAPEYTSAMDVGFRGSAVAVGAAVFNARVAAAAQGILGPVDFGGGDDRSPLSATMRFGGGADPHLAGLYRPMLMRETNRHHGAEGRVDDDTVEQLKSVARSEGARLHLLTSRSEITEAATILAAADRVRYLTPRLHTEMMAELRIPGDRSLDTGIDVRSLELDAGELLQLDVLRRAEVMALLAQWDSGAALGRDTHARICASSALAVVSVRGHSLSDYAHGGSAVEAAWIVAQQHELAVQPVSPVFLYAHDDDDLNDLSPTHAGSLRHQQSAFRDLAQTGFDEVQVLVFRLFTAPRASVRSRRRLGGECTRSG